MRYAHDPWCYLIVQSINNHERAGHVNNCRQSSNAKPLNSKARQHTAHTTPTQRQNFDSLAKVNLTKRDFQQCKLSATLSFPFKMCGNNVSKMCASTASLSTQQHSAAADRSCTQAPAAPPQAASTAAAAPYHPLCCCHYCSCCRHCRCCCCSAAHLSLMPAVYCCPQRLLPLPLAAPGASPCTAPPSGTPASCST